MDKAAISKMEQSAVQPGCWPTEMQELLLQACLFDEKNAVQAWEAWKSRIDIDWIDEGSNRLLPLLYHNLSSLGIQDPLLTKAKGVYRYQMTKTHIMFHRSIPLLNALQEAGIEVMLLKGAALILDYYNNFGIRPQLDIDFMVKPEKAIQAARLLQQQGLLCEYQQPVKTIQQFRHSCGFAGGPEKRLDLHWNILHPRSDEDTVSEFWKFASETQYHGTPLLTMAPTHHLLHTCTHGLHWNRHAPCRWVADAMTILRKPGTQIDWDALVTLSKGQHVSLVVMAALQYLKNTFHADIPDIVISDLNENPINRMERIAFHIHTRNKGKIYGNLLKYSVDYVRSVNPSGFFNKITHYPRYLQICWNTKTILLMPVELINQVLKQHILRWKEKLLVVDLEN